jgi:hypothetical protein
MPLLFAVLVAAFLSPHCFLCSHDQSQRVISKRSHHSSDLPPQLFLGRVSISKINFS